MTNKVVKKFIREGHYAAEVEATLIDDDPPGIGWGTYLSLRDAEKLDYVRAALREGDLETASRLGRVFELRPVAAE